MKKNSLTLTDAFAMIAFVMVCVSLLLPSIARHRTAARATQCADNLKQIALGLHNYHSAYGQLPQGLGGTDGNDETACNKGRLGPMVALLPFINQQELWEKIFNPFVGSTSNKSFPRMGPAPWYDPQDYTPWSNAPSLLTCPEIGGNARQEELAKDPMVVTTLEMPITTDAQESIKNGMMSNYVACNGDGTQLQDQRSDPSNAIDTQRLRLSRRGAFSGNMKLGFRDFLDGLSYTILYSEAITEGSKNYSLSRIAKNVTGLSQNPSLCLAATEGKHADWWDIRRGSRWCDGTLAITGFQTVLPPNSPSCLSEVGTDDPIASASSLHAGGVHVLFGDGRVAFVTNEVDCGASSSPGVGMGKGYASPGSKSPYGLWGALGTRAAKEVIRPEEPSIQTVASNSRDNTQGADRADSFSSWTDNTGKIRLTAKFNRLIDQTTVELEDTTGVLHRVPLNTLSNKDILRAVNLSFE